MSVWFGQSGTTDTWPARPATEAKPVSMRPIASSRCDSTHLMVVTRVPAHIEQNHAVAADEVHTLAACARGDEHDVHAAPRVVELLRSHDTPSATVTTTGVGRTQQHPTLMSSNRVRTLVEPSMRAETSLRSAAALLL
jgi:hypothetical protein